MPTQTSVFNLNKPTVAGDADTWGGSSGLNGTIDKIESALKATATTGSSNAYVLSSGLSLTAYATGQTFRIIPNFTNSGAATINVDGLGAKNITKTGSTALASGDLVSGRIYTISYDGTQFQVVEINALESTLATIAALTPTTDQAIYFTGPDTAATMAVTAAGRAMAGAASATAQTALLDTFTGDSGSGGLKGLVRAPAAGDSTKYLKGDGTWATVNPVLSWGSPVGSWTWSTNVTQIDFTGLSSYSELYVVLYGITYSAAPGTTQLRWSTDNGATFLTTGYGSTNSSAFVNSLTPTLLFGTAYLTNFNSASQVTMSIATTASGTAAGSSFVDYDTTARAHNAIRITTANGVNFTAGAIRVYGKI